MRRPAILIPTTVIALASLAQETTVVETVRLYPAGMDNCPVLLDSTVVISSMRERPSLAPVRAYDTNEPFSDLYAFDWNGQQASSPRLFSEALCGPLNDGPATFGPGGTTICFTRNQSDVKGRTRKDADHLGLFFSTLKDGEWTTPVPFDYNSGTYNVMHPSLSPDGRTLIFASDMPGGYGGADLFKCELEDGAWSTPLNMGPEVNSPSHELFPGLSANWKLRFASDREGGLGKLDLYVCAPDGPGWNRPEALPAPMNSTGNDYGYTSFPTDRSGFLTSDRDGSDRIYQFRRMVPLFTDCREQREISYCYAFAEPRLSQANGLPVHPRWDLGDGTVIDGPEVRHCYAGPGRYKVSLDLVDNTSGHVFFHQNDQELVIQDISQPYINCADSLRSGRKEPLDARGTHLPGITAEEYHWSFDDGSTAFGRTVDHSWGAIGEHVVKLAVLGTDNTTGAIVSFCSTRTVHVIKRSDDVVDQVVASTYEDASGSVHQFSFELLPHDDQTLAKQDGKDATFSVEILASTERLGLDDPRFEEIRKFYPVKERYDPIRAQFIYSVGQANDLKELYEVFQKVLEFRFLDAEAAYLPVDKVTDISALSMLSPAELNNSLVRASTVLFDNGKASFAAAFRPQLDKIVQLLKKHPGLSVVIEAHTDATGSNSSNLQLSQARAQSILDYLVQGGAASDHLVPIGHGENAPIATNTTSRGRALNRRVDFRLVMRDEQAYTRP